MPTYTLNVSTKLYVSECCACDITFGMPDDFDTRRRNDHRSFYCPAGHAQSYSGPSEAQKERKRAEAAEREAQRLRDRLVAEATQRETMRRRHAATKGQLTKARKRADAGVCQHCRRSFANVARHVAHMHPETVSS